MTSSTVRRIRSLSALAACLSPLLFAAPAMAESASISVLDPAGKEDPVTGVPRTFKVSGTTSSPVYVYIKQRNPGPTPCANTAQADSGEWFGDYETGWDAREANGDFSFSDVYTTNLNGPKMFCIWLAKDSETIVNPITQTINFRSPSGTISGAVNPLAPAPDQVATLTVTGVTEAPKYVYAKLRPAGAPCATTYSADTGYGLISGEEANGNFSVSDTFTVENAGDYVICMWLASASDDAAPVAGPQPVNVRIGTPPPPGPSAECMDARRAKATMAGRIKKTKRALLKARRKSTRRVLIRRLSNQRRAWRLARSNVNALC